MPGYVTVTVEAEIDAGATVARHTHPGIESAYVIDGGGELLVDGQPAMQVTPGIGFQNSAGDTAQPQERRQAEQAGNHLHRREGQATGVTGMTGRKKPPIAVQE